MAQSAAIYSTDTELTCATCDAPLHDAEAHYGHPLITARQLTTMAVHTAIRSPKLFSELMLKELPPVPYCAACRQQLSAQRQAEQIKFLMGMLLVLALLAGVVVAGTILS